MTKQDHKFSLVDTKEGKLAAFETADEARGALRQWIALQRQAGEPVVQLPTGAWKDSRVTTWISGPDEKIVPLDD